MGRQVNFYMMPEDIADIETELKARGDVVFLAHPSPVSEPQEVETLTPLPGDFGIRYLVRPDDFGRVRTIFSPARGDYMVDSSGSPVVEFSRGGINERTGRLSNGRIYVQTSIRDVQGTHVKPEPEFLAWGDSLMKMIRKNKQYSLLKDPGEHGVYISRRATEWRERGGVLGY